MPLVKVKLHVSTHSLTHTHTHTLPDIMTPRVSPPHCPKMQWVQNLPWLLEKDTYFEEENKENGHFGEVGRKKEIIKMNSGPLHVGVVYSDRDWAS